MTWSTRALFGIGALWLLAPVPPEIVGCDFGTLAAFAVLGALLPDLDASESKIKHLKPPGTQFKPFLLPAQMVSREVKPYFGMASRRVKNPPQTAGH